MLYLSLWGETKPFYLKMKINLYTRKANHDSELKQYNETTCRDFYMLIQQISLPYLYWRQNPFMKPIWAFLSYPDIRKARKMGSKWE